MGTAWRIFERFAHWVGLFIAIAAIVAVGVIIGRPAEKSGYQPNFTNLEQQQKRLVVFFDGTWNSVEATRPIYSPKHPCAG